MVYDPEHWYESTVRTLEAYVKANMNSRVYDVEMEFPGAIVDSQKVPLKKTMLHFAIDDVKSSVLGMGDNAFAQNYDASTHSIFPQYANQHEFTFDVGVWASDRSGGTTQRMRARQQFEFLFGSGGIDKLRSFSDGGDGVLEILSFTGGTNVLDESNGVRLYRMVNCMLVIRVFSRTPLPSTGIATIEQILQSQTITITG